MVFYRVEPLDCTNGLARIQKKHKNDQARNKKDTMREEAAWRYKLLILLGLVTLFTLLTMPYTAYIVSTAHTAYYTAYPF